MNIWQFFDNHWFIAWCSLWLCWPAFWLAREVFFLLPNRLLRTIKVCARGWPPGHLDADGDHKPAPKEAKP